MMKIVTEILEKKETDKTYIKYVSALVDYTIKDLNVAGYTDIIIKEWNSLRKIHEKKTKHPHNFFLHYLSLSKGNYHSLTYQNLKYLF